MSKPRCQVSIDLETLGTSPDSVILSIGAAAVCAETGQIVKFYGACAVDSQQHRTISKSTLDWWDSQSAEARVALDFARSDDCPSLQSTLKTLTDWLAKLGETHDVYVWGNGSDFDIAMLNHAYKQISDFVPWNFRSSRDMRTLRDICLRLGLEPKIKAAVSRNGTHHNALDDAEYQAGIIMESLRQIDLAAEFLRGPAKDEWQAFLARSTEAACD